MVMPPPEAAGLQHAPWVIEAFTAIMECRRVETDRDVADLVPFRIATLNACRFCYGAWRTVLSVSGFPEARIREVEAMADPASLSRRQRSALAFASDFGLPTPWTGSPLDRRLVEEGFRPAEAAEVGLHAAKGVFLTRLMTLAGAQPYLLEKLGRWWARPLRPFARALLAWTDRAASPSPSGRAPDSGPLGALASRIDGLRAAAVIRDIGDAAIAPGPIPTRARWLVILVIARTLGARSVEDAAAARLHAEGLDTSTVEGVLANLGGSGLDDLERRLVPLARDTASCRGEVVHPRVAALAADLEPAALVDLLGLAATTNALCRLERLAGPAAETTLDREV
jgi:alkylhydroperoxidase family enzyme